MKNRANVKKNFIYPSLKLFMSEQYIVLLQVKIFTTAQITDPFFKTLKKKESLIKRCFFLT